MKKIDPAKYAVFAYTLLTSPIAGLTLLGYMLYKDNQVNTLQKQLEVVLELNESLQKEEKDVSISIDDLNEITIKGNVTNFEIYKDHVIENYQSRFYRIQTPTGEYILKIFLTQEDAKKEVDRVEPFLVKHVRERHKIYNIRYVK